MRIKRVKGKKGRRDENGEGREEEKRRKWNWKEWRKRDENGSGRLGGEEMKMGEGAIERKIEVEGMEEKR